MGSLETLLAVVLKWALRCGLDEGQAATAQSLAWHYRGRCEAQYPDSHWAKLAVRAVRHGRDLPGCGTGQADALMHSHQGSGMPEVRDRTPPPDVLADHKERYERVMAGVGEVKKLVAAMRIEGWSNYEIALALKVSPGRTSQVAREIVERFLNDE